MNDKDDDVVVVDDDDDDDDDYDAEETSGIIGNRTTENGSDKHAQELPGSLINNFNIRLAAVVSFTLITLSQVQTEIVRGSRAITLECRRIDVQQTHCAEYPVYRDAVIKANRCSNYISTTTAAALINKTVRLLNYKTIHY